MLIHTKELLEYEARTLIGINSKFDKLMTLYEQQYRMIVVD